MPSSQRSIIDSLDESYEESDGEEQRRADWRDGKIELLRRQLSECAAERDERGQQLAEKDPQQMCCSAAASSVGAAMHAAAAAVLCFHVAGGHTAAAAQAVAGGGGCQNEAQK